MENFRKISLQLINNFYRLDLDQETSRPKFNFGQLCCFPCNFLSMLWSAKEQKEKEINDDKSEISDLSDIELLGKIGITNTLSIQNKQPETAEFSFLETCEY